MPDTKFYTLLGVSKTATDAELKSAYKKAALKHHPDRGGDEKKFKEISEAYEVLSDSNKRAVYDQFGEAGLKGQAPPGASGPGGAGANPFGAGGFGGFPGGGAPGGFSFSTSGGNPFGGGMGGAQMDPRDLFSSLFGDALGGGMGGARSSFGGGRPGAGMQFDDDDDDMMPGAFGRGPKRRSTGAPTPPEPASEVVKPLPVSLEDLMAGCTKKMKLSRRMLDGTTSEKILSVTVKPGYKQGTRIKYDGAGNEEMKGSTVTSQNVVFVVEEKPHPIFKREGDDLVYRLKLPLVDALTGPSNPAGNRKSVVSLDKRSIPFSLPTPPIKPDQEIRISGEGFPITRKDSTKRKGDLIVRVEIVFPDRLSEAQSTALRKALA